MHACMDSVFNFQGGGLDVLNKCWRKYESSKAFMTPQRTRYPEQSKDERKYVNSNSDTQLHSLQQCGYTATPRSDPTGVQHTIFY